jgi:hypothetical protein
MKTICDCDCELPKQEKWQQIREIYAAELAQDLADLVTVPRRGDFFIRDGLAMPVTDSWINMGPTSDGRTRWMIVTKVDPDD